MKKNQVKSNLLEELVNLLEQDSGGVQGHSGAKGQGIDMLFSGPFHPEFGDLKQLLQYQLDWRKEIATHNKKITPKMDLLYKAIEEYEKKIKDAITPHGEAYRDTEIVYDDVVKMTDKEIDNFKNDTNQFKPISSFNKFI